MHCAICDADDDSVTHINTDCSSCQSVISDTIASYDKIEEEVIEDVPYDDDLDYNDLGCKMSSPLLTDEGEDTGYHDSC